jgi:hypothetical protein
MTPAWPGPGGEQERPISSHTCSGSRASETRVAILYDPLAGEYVDRRSPLYYNGFNLDASWVEIVWPFMGRAPVDRFATGSSPPQVNGNQFLGSGRHTRVSG